MNEMKHIKNSINIQRKYSIKSSKNSKKPDDGDFITYDPNDSFNADGTVRYGEEQDVDDL